MIIASLTYLKDILLGNASLFEFALALKVADKTLLNLYSVQLFIFGISAESQLHQKTYVIVISKIRHSGMPENRSYLFFILIIITFS